MTHLLDRSARLCEMSQTLELGLPESEIASLSDSQYLFVSHTRPNKTGVVEYFLAYPHGTDDIESAQFVAWGSGFSLPIPDFIIDLDAERPLVEVDALHTTEFRLVLLKRRYGPADRPRIDERVRRRLWVGLRRDRRGWRKIGFRPHWDWWLDLDYRTFWSRGGIAGLDEWAAKHAPPITSRV